MTHTPLWQETPLLYSSKISGTLGASVYLKLENLHPSHSFKYRGISLFVQRAKETHGSSVHLVIASGGNAGLAAACAANALHVKCTVFLPEGAAQGTLDILQRQNAEVVIIGRLYAEALRAAQNVAVRMDNTVLVPAYDHEILWEGHGSMVEEISSQLSCKPDAIFCSVGGGGLLGGLIVGCKKVGWDNVPIVTIETIGSDCFFHTMSLNNGRFNCHDKLLPVNVRAVEDEETGLHLAHFDKFGSRASGSLGASQPSAKVVEMSLERAGKVKCVSVPDELSMQALSLFVDDQKLLVELACSTALTPAYKPAFFNELVSSKTENGERTVVFIVCGGFKTTMDEIMDYKKIVDEDVKKSGFWDVLMDDGSVTKVEK